MEKVKGFAKDRLVLIVTVLLIALMSLLNRKFLTANNLYGLLISLPAYGMCALGLCVSLIGGELNISMGSLMAFSGVLFAKLVPGMGALAALAIALTLCMAWGLIGGFFVAVLKIDSFVVTLSLMTLVRGVALALSNQRPIIITDKFTVALGMAKVGPIPVTAIVLLAFALAIEYALKKTVFGRNLYAVGANKEIARSVGIGVVREKMAAFVIFSLCAGVGGYMLAGRMNAGSPVSGSDAPLSVIPMVIIGGTALSGGRGGAVRTLLGVFLLQFVFNAMSLYSITQNMQLLVKGAIVLAIVVWDKYSANRHKKV